MLLGKDQKDVQLFSEVELSHSAKELALDFLLEIFHREFLYLVMTLVSFSILPLLLHPSDGT